MGLLCRLVILASVGAGASYCDIIPIAIQDCVTDPTKTSSSDKHPAFFENVWII
jgi:hypothetical protein